MTEYEATCGEISPEPPEGGVQLWEAHSGNMVPHDPVYGSDRFYVESEDHERLVNELQTHLTRERRQREAFESMLLAAGVSHGMLDSVKELCAREGLRPETPEETIVVGS